MSEPVRMKRPVASPNRSIRREFSILIERLQVLDFGYQYY
jgi:hypothetical protein